MKSPCNPRCFGVIAAILLISQSVFADIVQNVPSAEVDTVGACTLHGIVMLAPEESDSTAAPEIAISAVVFNANSRKWTATGRDGRFAIGAFERDTIEFQYIGYETKNVIVKDVSEPITVTLKPTFRTYLPNLPYKKEKEHILDLYLVDEDGTPLDQHNVFFERVSTDEDGEEIGEGLYVEYIDGEHIVRLDWTKDGFRKPNGKMVKKATIRIEAEGYDPVYIKVKRPRGIKREMVVF